MSKFTKIVSSFKNGKVSPKLLFRQDIPELKDSCSDLTNFYVKPFGGAERRFGTTMLDQLKYDSGLLSPLGNGNLYPLNYSTQHSYIIYLADSLPSIFESEFRSPVNTTSKFVRIFSRQGEEYTVRSISSGPTLSPWYDVAYGQAFNPAIVSSFTALPSSGWQTTQLGRKTIFTHTSGTKMPFVVDLMISDGTTRFMVYPWCFDKDLFTRKATTERGGGTFVPMGGLTIPCTGFSTNTLSVASTTTFTGYYTAGKVNEFSGGADKKMFRQVVITNFPILSNAADYIGAAVILRNASNQDATHLIVSSTAVGSDMYFGTICTCEATAANFTATSWAFSQWGGPLGFPKAVTTYKGRVVFGGTPGNPSTFWATSISANNPNTFQTLLPFKLGQDAASPTDVSGFLYFGAYADTALAASFNEAGAGDIQWIRGRKYLHFGTTVGEHQISFVNGLFDVANMETSKVSSYSSAPVQVTEGNQKMFYVTTDKTSIRFISTNDKYSESEDVSLSVLNQEYSSIEKIAWCESGGCLLFRTGTKMHSISVNQQSGVLGFGENECVFDVVDFVVLNGWDTTADNAYILAHYGGAYRLLSMPFKAIQESTSQLSNTYGYHYLDLAVATSNYTIPGQTGTVSITDTRFASKLIGYYMGENYGEVTANASGVMVFPIIPTTMLFAFLTYGLPFESTLKTSYINEGSKYGDANGLIKRIDRVTLNLTKSGACTVGSDNGIEDPVMFPIARASSTAWVDSNPTVELSSNPDYNVRCIVKSVNGQPLNISSIAFRGVTYEGE